MAIGTYGLGTPMSPGAGGDLGLAGAGVEQQREASDMLGLAAQQEAQREATNAGLRQQRKQGRMGAAATGATIGAQYGGGWGALAGGVIGYVAAGLLD